jgi:tetratricopeptide (TPR) repeat protein
MRAKSLSESRALPFALFFLALGLRLWHVASLRALPSFDHPYEGLDAELYTNLARSIAGGDLFPAGLLDAAPLYAYWLAAFLRFFGDASLAPRIAQALLGASVSPLLWAAGKRARGPMVGAIAGIAAAVFPPFLLYEGSLQSAALVPFLTTLLLVLLAAERTGARRAVLAGLVLGLSVLNRPDLAPLLLLIPGWLYFARGRRPALTFLAASLLLIAPFSTHASARAGGFVPLTAHGGIHFYLGNHDGADGTLSPVEGIPATPEGFARDARALARRESGRPLEPAEVSRFYLGKGVAWIASHPKEFALLLGRKALLFWNEYEIPNNEDLSFLRRYSAPLRFPLPLFGITAAFALYAATTAFRGWRRAADVPLLLLLTVFGTGLLFFVTGRYRLPAVPVLILFAAGGSVRWAAALRGRRAHALLLLPLLLFTNAPVRRFDSAGAESRLASSYLRAGDLAKAEEAYRRAELAHPGFAEARRGLARIRARTGRMEEALSLYREEARAGLAPRRARNDLAALLAESGRWEEAAALLDTLLDEDPFDATSLTNLAALRMQQGNDSLAAELLEKATAIEPDHVEALLDLALLRTKEGRLEEAIRLFDRHLMLDGSSERGLFNAGVARAMNGDLEGAVRMWERLERIDAAYPNLGANLSRARAALEGRGGGPPGGG